MAKNLYPKWTPDLLEAFEVMTGYAEAAGYDSESGNESISWSTGVAREALRNLYDRQRARRANLKIVCNVNPKQGNES